MTAPDPLTPWRTPDSPPDTGATGDYLSGADDRLDALRPLIAAADALHEVAERGFGDPDPEWWTDLAAACQDYETALTTPKGRNSNAAGATGDYLSGANDLRAALRPLIAAAEELAAAVLDGRGHSLSAYEFARIVRDLTTPKGDTP